MKVQNMTSHSGNKVANQFVVTGEHTGQSGQFFQSYDSVIAFSPADGSTVTLDRTYWDYSRTTSKYRNQFLNMTTAEIKAGIKSGSIILADLNS